jgi:acetoin utilization deacetylase AcuC-like enzyme
MVINSARKNNGGCFAILEGGYNHAVIGQNAAALNRRSQPIIVQCKKRSILRIATFQVTLGTPCTFYLNFAHKLE